VGERVSARRGRLSAIAFALVIAVSGCGGGSGSTTNDDSTPQAVAVAWSNALNSGDGKTACSLMTPGSVREVEKPLKPIPPLPIGNHHKPVFRGRPARPCPVVMSRGSGPKLPPASTTISGHRAIVQMKQRTQIMHRVVLLNVDGDWRVDFARTFGNPFGTD
jgi:hypothetical protein